MHIYYMFDSVMQTLSGDVAYGFHPTGSAGTQDEDEMMNATHAMQKNT